MLRNLRLIGILSILLLLCTVNRAIAQKDKIEGQWYNDVKSARIEIYKAVDGKFWGKIVWLQDPNKDGKPKTDDNNPNEKFRSRPIINLPILSHFVKKNNTTYDDGEIYDPKNGKTYSCTITYRNDKELGIRGYVGISLLGRTTTWTRAD